MKTLLSFVAYAIASGLIGIVVCSTLAWGLKAPRAALAAAAAFFGGPFLVYGYLQWEANDDARQFEADLAYVQELCARYGGDKIYRTVDDVEGVFQMKARNPDQDKQWADQFGMLEPWALAFGDRDWNPVELGTAGAGYWFLEQQPGFGLPEGPPFRRTVLVDTGMKVRDEFPYAPNPDAPLMKREKLSVQKLKSRYGYTTEDLTTPELRKRWIGGGKLKIIDLRTNEVLAERTDFYRATGPGVKMAWTAGTPCPAGPPRLVKGADHSFFITAVLRPQRALPTKQQLSNLMEE